MTEKCCADYIKRLICLNIILIVSIIYIPIISGDTTFAAEAYKKTITLSNDYFLKIVESIEKETVTVHLIHNEKVVKSIVVDNASLDDDNVQRVNLDGSGELDYFLTAYDRSSTYGGQTNIIVWNSGRIWDMCEGPFQRGFAEDRNHDGITEVVEYYREEMVHIFIDGSFYPVKTKILSNDVYVIQEKHYSQMQSAFKITKAKVFYAGISKIIFGEKLVPFVIYEEGGVTQILFKLNHQFYSCRMIIPQASNFHLVSIYSKKVTDYSYPQLIIVYNAIYKKGYSDVTQTRIHVLSWVQEKIKFETIFSHDLKNIASYQFLQEKSIKKIVITGYDGTRSIYVWKERVFTKE